MTNRVDPEQTSSSGSAHDASYNCNIKGVLIFSAYAWHYISY